jgi:hypothetical protein
MAIDYQVTNQVEIELDGQPLKGRYRVMAGSVIVYYKDKLKFADHGMTPPAVIAKWLLKDLCRQLDAKKHKTA